MPIDKKTFLKTVTILYDTREQKNQHILTALGALGVPCEERKLDYGDYSFTSDSRDGSRLLDFSLSCVIERKANVDELYNNIMSDRGRLEKELYAASQCAKQLTMIVENIGGWEELRSYGVPAWQMKANPQRVKEDIGVPVYSTLKSWQSGNRYRFSVEFVPDKAQTAAKMLEIFYYYWRTYKEMTGVRKSE